MIEEEVPMYKNEQFKIVIINILSFAKLHNFLFDNYRRSIYI